ncbi:putative acyltransferase [Mycobacteroides abscessus subsp. abscessus]|nr:putative acyltransferase [Mycobacteroides abscessus subsp. abscessus]
MASDTISSLVIVQPATRTQFRPDIEGLRAIAVGVVVAFHGFGVPFLGGFVGVDVFFVISGFLITSLLLREGERTGGVSILAFYARRVRRILPASALVVGLTVVAAYCFLGFITGNDVAIAAKWTAIFAANIHFGLIGTDYLGSQLPPSPLQHMWSLGVEEQFYLVWPAVVMIVILVVKARRYRCGLAVVLCVVIAASFAWSIVQTQDNATWAYFSPLTRACELGIGALISVSAPWIGRVRSRWLSEGLAVVGLAGIFAAALLLNSSARFPGYSVALPVISSGLVIWAGCANERTQVARLLSVKPMVWVGARSYSLYLWHWPILIIAKQYLMTDLTLVQRSALVFAAVVLSAVSYSLIENPFRNSKKLASRNWLSLTVGIGLVSATVVLSQAFIATHGGSWNVLEPSSFQ